MAFTVKLDLATMARSSTGTITGVLYVEVDGLSYPETGWNDMPVVVLTWWLEAIGDLQGGAPGVHCRFMDGPFSFAVRPLTAKGWRVSALDRGGQPLHAAEAESNEVVQAIAGAAEEVVRECAALGWATKEVEDLREALRRERPRLRGVPSQ